MRARNIKPAFFKNEHLAELSPHARLLYLGLWCLADCEGRLEDRPARIKAEIFPYENADVEAWLSALASSSGQFIVRYEVDGQRFIEIPTFTKHQSPHKKEREAGSRIPPRPDPGSYQHHAGTMPVRSQHHASPGNSGTSPADMLNPDILKTESLHGCDSVESPKEDFSQLELLNDQANEETDRSQPEQVKKKQGAFSPECKALVNEFKQLLESHGQTVFPRDWSLTSYACCQSLLKQGKTEEEIRRVMRWAVTECAWKDKITHFKGVVNAYAHWEREHPGHGLSGERAPGSKLEYKKDAKGLYTSDLENDLHPGRDLSIPFEQLDLDQKSERMRTKGYMNGMVLQSPLPDDPELHQYVIQYCERWASYREKWDQQYVQAKAMLAAS